MKNVITAIGLMSGTSADGVDASIISSDGEKVISFGQNYYLPYEYELKSKIHSLYNLKEKADKNFIKQVEEEITYQHIKAVFELLELLDKDDVKPEIIGFHGHTIDHQPQRKFTWQIGDGNLLAKKTGINVIYNFRANDIANGGQGAPVIPIYHKAIIDEKYYPAIVLNVGGVSNITYIDDKNLIAFDVGAGNALIDDFLRQEGRFQYDEGGRFALQGSPNFSVISEILQDDFFKKPYPKSLDRNEFRQKVFDILQKNNTQIFYDKVATIAEITVQSVLEGIKLLPQKPKYLFFCGGGAKNFYFLKRLSEILENTKVEPISIVNERLDTDYIESQGFGFLAVRSMLNKPITFSSTTGVSLSSAVGGVFCPA
ncbi:MAG: anhydro-N-acetylmuramic acid kinase [Rickettsiales bacterium]|nr:anhydro-N-acetylmuramic acid kinase [Rickettsiales bacterium]